MDSVNLAVFASGSGSNAENIIRYFSNHSSIRIKKVLTNNPNAYVIDRAKNLNVPVRVFNRHEFYETGLIINDLKSDQIQWIILAGFLWLVPASITEAFPGRIVNIHPALLPKYGGKGMYGEKVHQAVKSAGEKESGITIHYVNNEYDKGNIIFQARCPVDPSDTPETIAEKVHGLEYKHYPEVIENLICK
ncbi:MAG: phosphoribosylglycinamide formyltransferase [Bacteroidales bacterium]|nr:phosphoribosylglycinamide formyltransferase [Bacteroidales bacterium]